VTTPTPDTTQRFSAQLHAELVRFAEAKVPQVHRLQLRLAELLLNHAPPGATGQLELALGFVEGRTAAAALHEARQDCWTYVGSLACGCSVADSASAHAIMVCLETDATAHSPAALVEQVERSLRCGASEADVLGVLRAAQVD
jgi:acyl-CoA reductase-like NAD-dependent aldehyde dehydrogenase